MSVATSPSEALSLVEEIALVGRIRAGDQSACGKLVKQFGPQMLATARRFMRNDEDSDDAVQDAFISIFNAIDRFKGDSPLATWLHRITVNCCLMKLRAGSSRKETSIEDLLGSLEARDQLLRWCSGIHNPAVKVQVDETRAVVRQAIDQLPEGYRKVLRLRYIEEVDTAATAVLLNTTENNVKCRVRRARRALFGQLQPLMTGEIVAPAALSSRTTLAMEMLK
jgi:RNA polymerase sigma-70 factor (ECF subfamily)